MIDSIKYMNIDEQIEHLESKGLVIKNKKTAKKLSFRCWLLQIDKRV